MGLKLTEMWGFRKAIKNSHRPLIFFDDDCDGLSSFLQVYKVVGDGRGIPVKDSPVVGTRYNRKVDDYSPDLVVILDKPGAEQDFLDKISQKVYWLDHHEPQNPKGVKYLNPRVHKDSDNAPTSYWMYKILKQNLWIAMVGVVADWHLPDDMAKKFRKEYPDLLPEDITTPEAAIHDSLVGKLTRIWSFNLKGTVADTMESVKVLTRIKDPYEILNQTSTKGKFIYKKYDKLNKMYEKLLKSVEVTDDNLLVFTYNDIGTSFTSDLSNELLYRYPDKVGIIGRIDNSRVKCSIRSKGVDVASILKEALKEVDGSGGGHTNACGANVKLSDFEKFTEIFRKSL